MQTTDFPYVLPSLGADMDEAALIEWKIKPGDKVKRGQVVAVLETVKAAIDAEIWVDGTVEELLFPADKDRKIKVGTPLARIKTDVAINPTPPAPLPTNVATEAIAAQSRRSPSSVRGENKTPLHVMGRGGRRPGWGGGAGRIRISPAARRRMQELGLSESDLTAGDAPLGIADIEKAAANRTSLGRTTMRGQIAKAMSRSKREIPHYYLATDIDLSDALKWLRSENEKRSLDDRILPATLLIRAVALALKRYPQLNGFYVNNAAVPSEAIHIGMAFALREGGLIAPAIHNTDTLGIGELMKALSDLGERTRTGGLKAAELADPTITITSLGDLGVEEIFPIITPPQVAMIGFGMLMHKPWVVAGKVEVREVIRATLAADHRVSDGRDGALFLSEIKDLLEQVGELTG